MPLAPGIWAVDVEADAQRWRMRCYVGEQRADTFCELPRPESSVENGFTEFSLETIQDDASLLLSGWWLRIEYVDDHAMGIEHTGPDDVRVGLTFDGTEIAHENWSPDYTRMYHRGEAECGFCDVADEVIWAFAAPGSSRTIDHEYGPRFAQRIARLETTKRRRRRSSTSPARLHQARHHGPPTESMNNRTPKNTATTATIDVQVSDFMCLHGSGARPVRERSRFLRGP